MMLLQTGHTPLYNIKHFWINRRTAGKVNPGGFFNLMRDFLRNGAVVNRAERLAVFCVIL